MTALFESETLMRCPVDHAFTVFTDRVDLWWPKGHRKFDSSAMSFDASPGGQLVERAADGAVMLFAEVLESDPPALLRLAWHPGKVGLPTEVTIRFEVEGEATRVRVVHHEGQGDLGTHRDQRTALFAQGWTNILAACAAHIEGD